MESTNVVTEKNQNHAVSNGVQLSVPFYSQYRDVVDPVWQSRACGGVCLKMALDFLAQKCNATIPAIPELIEEAVTHKAYSTGSGWVHRGMVFLAHNHGIPAYPEEFRSMEGAYAKGLVEYGYNKIIKTVRSERPVIVSIEKGFEDGGSFHQVLIVGEKDDGEVLMYHDPEAKDESGAFREIGREKFCSHWRHFAIFVG